MASITKRGDTYRIRCSCGYDGEGKQVMRSTTWKPYAGMTEKQEEKELARQVMAFENKCRGGIGGGNIRFSDFTDQWFNEYAASHLKRRTLSEYRRMTKRTYAAIGHIRLDKLRPHHMREFFAQLAEPGQNQRTGAALSSKTIWDYYSFCSSVLGYAVKNEIIDKNPCSIAAPKKETKAIACLDDVQAQALMAALDEAPMEDRVFFTLALFTGYWRGELLGLEWQDIDFKRAVITIRRTSQYSTGHGTYTDTPKTASSQRSTKISSGLVDMLKEYKAYQEHKREAMGDLWVSGWQECPRLFTSQNGSPMHPGLPEKRLKKILERTGLPLVTLHSLRHTNATLLIASGVDVKTVSARLGHSQTSTTMNIYAEAIQSAEAAAADVLDDILTKKKAP